MSDTEKVQQDQDDALHKLLDHQRWLMNNGLVNDMHKDQLYLFGAIVHKDIKAVELDIEIENKNVNYYLYIDSGLRNKINKFNKLSKSQGLIGLWRFKNMLKKEGNLNFSAVIGRFIKDYCGPLWRLNVRIADIKDYKDGYEESSTPNKQSDS